MTGWLAWAIIMFSLSVLLIVRNDIVFDARMKRREIIARWNALAIAHGHRWSDNPTLLVSYELKTSYSAMHWRIRCWTYRQFFPEPVMDPGIAALHGIDWEEP